MEHNNVILVPWDFTEKAEFALQHAIQFSKIVDASVMLLNITKKEKEETEALNKLSIAAEECEKKYGHKPNVMVREGTIFKTINEVTDEIKALLVIMGTHGMRGMQKFTGSWALKVITGSNAPFLVVQEPPVKDQYKEIIFPMEFKTEDKEKLKWVNFLSQYFRAKVHICTPKITDPFILKKTRSNLVFAKNYLNSKNIDYDIEELNSASSFLDDVVEFAKNHNHGLILIMTTKNITLQDYVLGANEQQLIANKEGVPVMCVNPREGKLAGFY